MKPSEYIHKFTAQGNDIRFYLTKPCLHDGQLYASNGHILVVTEQDDSVVCIDDTGLAHRAEEIVSGYYRQMKVFPPLDLQLPEATQCMVCNGLGKTKICKTCEGEGVTYVGRESEFDAAITCSACDGRSEWPDESGDPCWHCDGTGNGFQSIKIGNAYFQRRYLALLQTLPGIHFLPDDDPSKLAYFRFEGGFGALMPCRQ